MAQGKRAWSWRMVWDAQRQRFSQGSVLALSVRHPDFPAVPLSFVVARGRERPWDLLTAEPITTEQAAWDLVFAYMRRWHLEEAFRYSTSDRAVERPRLWQWEHRVKLLLLATLASAFLFSLLLLPNEPVRLWLLRHFCHRTGQHCRHAPAPLSRVRSALSRLWQQHPPVFEAIGHLSQPPPPPISVTELAAADLLLQPGERLRLA